MTAKIEFRLLDYLAFQKPNSSAAPLRSFSESQWSRGLAMLDTAGLTLHLLDQLRVRDHFRALSAGVQQRLAKNKKDHNARVAAISSEFLEFNKLLQSHRIQYLALKGPMHCPDFVGRIEHRVQYDHDFLIGPQDLQRAFQLFLDLGYTPLESSDNLAVDHLPTLVRKTGWVWKGNLYDPEIPRAVELHFRLWDSDFELIPVHFPEDVWSRSVHRKLEGIRVPALCQTDALFHAVLHVFRHLLRNDLRLSHLYEVAYFLDTQLETPDFWESFAQSLGSGRTGPRIVATVFKLSEHCFACRMPQVVQQLIKQHLSPAGKLWVERFGRREAVDCFRKSKSAILLHLDLIETRSAKWKLLRRRWIPRHLPLPWFGVQTAPDQQSIGFRRERQKRYATQVVKRTLFHFFNLTRFLIEFPVWQWRLYVQKKAL